MSQDGERLARHTAKIETLEDDMKIIKQEMKNAYKHIYIATGGLGALMVILKLWAQH